MNRIISILILGLFILFAAGSEETDSTSTKSSPSSSSSSSSSKRVNGDIPGFRECSYDLGEATINRIGINRATQICCDRVGGSYSNSSGSALGGECRK